MNLDPPFKHQYFSLLLYINHFFSLNLKTGVDQSNYWDPKINRSYYEMAEHYGVAVVPARVRHPKDYSEVFVIPNI